MRDTKHMKKLILIPTVLVTALLVMAFVVPATAAGMLRTVTGVQLNLSSVSGSSSGAEVRLVSGQSNSPASQGALKGSKGQLGTSSNPASTSSEQSKAGEFHSSVSTAGHTNCGRYGGGFHGG